MIKSILSISLLLVLSAFAEKVLKCPAGTHESEKKEGNTRILSCLDGQGAPHGPFEVWAYPDTTVTGTGTLVVKGGFDHGMQDSLWRSFSKDGQKIVETEYKHGKQVGENNAAH